uniref:Uncharacterized protein n=1 Tax=Fagus sylvatica TaxID=28930 RepID=A0A2N9J865_FAGSY
MTRIPVKQNRKGIPTPTPLHQGRRRHQSQKGKTPKLDSKIDSLEEKIRLIQGLNSFGNTDFSSMSWFPNMTVPPKFKAPEFEKYNGRGDPMIHLQMYCRKMAPYADNEPLLIQTFQDTLTGNAAEWYSQLKKISHWKELADTFLAQYGFNSQIAPDRFDLQRMEKKSNETFREFFVDLIPVGERIEDALKTKKIVDMTALMALAEQAAKKAPTKRKEGDVQMIGRSNGKTKASPPNFHHAIGTTKAYSRPRLRLRFQPRPQHPQMPARPVGNQPNDNRWPRKEPRQFTPLPMPMTELYPILIEKNLISPTIPRPYNGAPRKDFNQNLTCDFHFGEFEGLPNITTNPLPNHPEGGVNMVEIEEGNEERILWRRLFYTLEKKRHITPLEAPPGPSTGDACEYHSGARGHSLECCEEFKKKSHQSDGERAGGERRNTIGKEPSTRGSDEGADWGYFMEDDTDEWKDVDFTKLFQFPCLIVPPGFETPEFEIFYENGDPEVHLQNLSKQAAAWFYQLRNLTGWDDLARVFLEAIPLQSPFDSRILGFEGKMKSPTSSPDPGPRESLKPSIITTTAEEEYAGPMVEGLSIHTITGEEDSTTTPPTRHCQQGEEAKTWTCVPLLQRVSSSNEVKSREKSRLEPAAPQSKRKALIALLREFHEDLRLVLPRHARPRHRHSGPQDSAEARMQARETSTATDEARTNIVPVPKKDGKVRMCVDYRDLNRASPKDNFPLPHIDTLVDNTATNAVFSFMDGFSGYNQIKMAEEDKSKTAFITHWGTFVYDVMPFGLKNAGATYQRAMVTLFHDMIHHEIEVYVDDMIAKSRTAQDHLTDLRKLFQATEEVSAQIEPEQVQAIRSMPAPKTEKEIRSFLGRINYIARFIAQLTATCEPLFKLLRKDVKIKWTEDCQRAFDKIKEYLLNPPILVPPTPGRPLILYLTVQEASMGCMLGQQDETGKKEQAIYYLSKKFTEPETRYLLVEKTCCALAWASKKLRQYMLYYTTWLVSRMDPIKYIFEKPAFDWEDRTDGKCSYLKFDILFVARKGDQGTGHSRLLGRLPVLSTNAVGSGIGAVLVSPKGQQTPIAVKLGFDCTNNMTEYEACIVVSQTNGEWQARDPKLIPYQRYISRLVPKFKYVTFTYTPRAHNHFADALATLASLIKLVEGDDVRPLRIETRDIPAYCVCVEECMNVEAEIDNKPWYYDIKRFIQDREFCTNELMTPPSLRCVDAEGSQSIDPRDARGIDGSPCQRTLPGPEDYESWLLLVDNGEGLHQTCPDVPQMPDVSEQQECTSPISSHYGLAVAFLSLGNGCDWCNSPQRRLTGMSSYWWPSTILPKMLITDNASNLNNRMMDQLCQQFKIQHHNSAPYRPKMNGAVEAANKNVKKILSKMTETYKDWHEHLPYALCAYRTWKKPEWAQARYEQLNFIDEKRLAALCHGQLYQRRIERAYNKKARPRTFQPGDLVLKKRNMALSDPRGKFAPSYEGPYVVKKAFSGRSNHSG